MEETQEDGVAIIHIRIPRSVKDELEATAKVMSKHFAGARFTQSDVVRHCLDTDNSLKRLREMYR